MRKIVFIVLAVVVAAVVGLFCWREFIIPDINFVDDFTAAQKGNQFRVQRLYAADVDLGEFEEKLGEITNTTEYTDEEILKAAIASGQPEFFPVFHFAVNRTDEEFHLDGYVDYGVAKGQKQQRFKMEKISFEAVVTGDITVQGIDVTSINEDDETESVVKANTEQQAAVDITDAKSFRISLDGQEGTVSLRFVYSVRTDSFFPKTALEEQYLEVHAVITPAAGNNFDVEYITEPYSNLEELSEQQA